MLAKEILKDTNQVKLILCLKGCPRRTGICHNVGEADQDITSPGPIDNVKTMYQRE
jgi:hypothetical protein